MNYDCLAQNQAGQCAVATCHIDSQFPGLRHYLLKQMNSS